ncbi:MAG TPA: glycosyltransferase [Gemmatimonadaceae bacterium]|nr:glycosyltransferase [Gemmatimonadaceae bacterium]
MRILQVLAPAEFGGLESVVALLAGGLRGRGHDVRVALVVAGPGDGRALERALTDGGVDVTRLELPGRAYAREWAAIAALCRRVVPDVVHTHGYRSDVIAGAAARRLGIAAATTVHGFTSGGWRNRVYEWLQRRAMRRFDAVVAVSRPLSERLARAGVSADRLHCIPNAYRPSPGVPRDEARRALGLHGDAPVLGWVGRLSVEKGPDVLVRALAELRDLPLQVAVVGDGPERATLATLAASLGVGDRIRWCGAVEGAARYFRAFDLLVLSSHTEGTPIVLFEAMAAGVPIVATAVGGVPDLVGNDEAVLVDRPEPGAVAAAIRRALADRAGGAARAERARARLVRDFAIDGWLDRHERLYDTVRRRRPHPS